MEVKSSVNEVWKSFLNFLFAQMFPQTFEQPGRVSVGNKGQPVGQTKPSQWRQARLYHLLAWTWSQRKSFIATIIVFSWATWTLMDSLGTYLSFLCTLYQKFRIWLQFYKVDTEHVTLGTFLGFWRFERWSHFFLHHFSSLNPMVAVERPTKFLTTTVNCQEHKNGIFPPRKSKFQKSFYLCSNAMFEDWGLRLTGILKVQGKSLSGTETKCFPPLIWVFLQSSKFVSGFH